MEELQGRGRPSKIDQNPDLKSIIIELAKTSRTLDEIAKICGVCPKTLDNWLAKDEDFLRSVHNAVAQADMAIELMAYKKAMGLVKKRKEAYFEDKDGKVIGDKQVVEETVPPSDASIQFWLMNRNRAKWSLKDSDEKNTESSIKIDVEDQGL